MQINDIVSPKPLTADMWNPEQPDMNNNVPKQVKITQEDFKVTSEIKSNVDKETDKKIRADAIVKTVFDKFVSVDDNGSLDLSGVPAEYSWTKEHILKSASNPLEQKIQQHSMNDVENMFNQKLSEREFDWAIQKLVSDESLEPWEKADIRDEFLRLKNLWIRSDIIALQEAESKIRNQNKKIIGTMPKIWRPSVQYSSSLISQDKLSSLWQTEYNRVMGLIENWQMTIT